MFPLSDAHCAVCLRIKKEICYTDTMISPVDLVKRMGVGGRLVPFFKCVCVYFVALGAGGGAPSPGAAAAKCAPVLCLLLLVLLHHAALPYHKGAYARRVAAALALSALGDALLVWPQHLVAGMAAFAGAHVAYVAALGWARRAAALGGALYGAALLFVWRVAPPPPLRAPVAAYALLLASTAWRGAARGGAAAAGALLFALSDALLAYGLFAAPVPCQQLLVMSTYYLAQLGLALSALRPEPVAAR